MQKIDLDMASNLFGKLGTDVRERLTAAIENPCNETWDDAHSIILNRESWTTLWQAVIAVDPSFPKTGPCHNTREGLPRDAWPCVPDAETIVQAVNYATH